MKFYSLKECKVFNKVFNYSLDQNFLYSDSQLLLFVCKNYLDQEFNKIDNYRLFIKDKQRRILLQFLNKLRMQQIYIHQRSQIEYFQHYIDNENLKMIIQIGQQQNKKGKSNEEGQSNTQGESDLQASSILEELQYQEREANLDKEQRWIAIYTDKSDFLGIKIANFAIKQIVVQNFYLEKTSIINNIIVKPQNIRTYYDVNNSVLYLYGNSISLEQYIRKYQQVNMDIKILQFISGDLLINNYLWSYLRGTSEQYFQTKIVVEEQNIFILYRSRSQALFNQIKGLGEIPNEKIYPLLKKDTQLKKYINRNSQLIYIRDIKLVGQQYQIQKINKILEIQNKKNQGIKQSVICKVLASRSLNITENNYKKLLQKIQYLKKIKKYHYYIQLNCGIKLTNFIKQAKKIFIVFNNYVDLIQLQTILPTSICSNKLKQIIQQFQDNFINKGYKIKLQNQIEILLFKRDEEQDCKQFIQILNSYHQLMKFIVIKQDYIQQLIKYHQQIKGHITVAINNFMKLSSQFYNQIYKKIDNQGIINKSKSKYNNQIIQFVQKLLKRNIKKYQVKGYKLDCISCYNIELMKIYHLPQIQLILSKNPKKEYVYFTFLQELYLIEKDKANNDFIKLQPCKIQKIHQYFSRIQENILKKQIKQAFLLGRQFFYISHGIDLIENIKNPQVLKTIIKTDELNLLLWKFKIQEIDVYEVKLQPKIDGSFIQDYFLKIYQIYLEDNLSIKELTKMKLGYGNFRKHRDQKGKKVYFQGNAAICLNIIQQLLKVYGSHYF